MPIAQPTVHSNVRLYFTDGTALQFRLGYQAFELANPVTDLFGILRSFNSDHVKHVEIEHFNAEVGHGV